MLDIIQSPLRTKTPPTRRGIIVDLMVESADKFVDFMGKTTKGKVDSLFARRSALLLLFFSFKGTAAAASYTTRTKCVWSARVLRANLFLRFLAGQFGGF